MQPVSPRYWTGRAVTIRRSRRRSAVPGGVGMRWWPVAGSRSARHSMTVISRCCTPGSRPAGSGQALPSGRAARRGGGFESQSSTVRPASGRPGRRVPGRARPRRRERWRCGGPGQAQHAVVEGGAVPVEVSEPAGWRGCPSSQDSGAARPAHGPERRRSEANLHHHQQPIRQNNPTELPRNSYPKTRPPHPTDPRPGPTDPDLHRPPHTVTNARTPTTLGHPQQVQPKVQTIQRTGPFHAQQPKQVTPSGGAAGRASRAAPAPPTTDRPGRRPARRSPCSRQVGW